MTPSQLVGGSSSCFCMNFAMASKVDPDKQGRLTLPEKLLRRTRIEREITLIGVRDHLELWNRSEWEARFLENMLFDGCAEVRDGLATPDRTRPGVGLELRQRDAARFLVWSRA